MHKRRSTRSDPADVQGTRRTHGQRPASGRLRGLTYGRKPDFVVEHALRGALSMVDMGIYDVLRFLVYHPAWRNHKAITYAMIAPLAQCSKTTVERSVRRLKRVGAVTAKRLYFSGPNHFAFPVEPTIDL